MQIDQTQLDAARTGDAEALDALLRAVEPLVLRRCARVLPFRPDAEEAAQEALLTIASRLQQYAGTGSFEGWVGTIATNQARMTYRSLRRRADEQGWEEMAEHPDPARVSVIAGSRVDLLEALDELERHHPEAVEAFVLRDLGAQPYAEIADVLGAPLGTVKARIHTARRFLRERLGEEPGEESQ
ncbi:RNA polymerase sigma factor [Nocardioides sp.]|uniref:RNA polymerase sigma factor n=1 Tax=Nocardioides sp. TaxID=35761 RepID=UPI0026325679|nr:RNA polymerase sigma factor [Nocardioides sp.]